MAKFHLIIIDNETGEDLADQDINGIIAGLDSGERVTTVGILHGNDADIAQTAWAAGNAIAAVLAQHTTASTLYKKLHEHGLKKVNKEKE